WSSRTQSRQRCAPDNVSILLGSRCRRLGMSLIRARLEGIHIGLRRCFFICTCASSRIQSGIIVVIVEICRRRTSLCRCGGIYEGGGCLSIHSLEERLKRLSLSIIFGSSNVGRI